MASLFPELLARVTKFGYENKWHLYYAKFNQQYHQSLLSHALNVGVLSVNLADLIIRVGLKSTRSEEIIRAWSSSELVDLVFLAGFLHDCGKSREIFQAAASSHLAGERVPSTHYSHQMPSEVSKKLEKLKEYLIQNGYSRSDQFWEGIKYCISVLGEIDNPESASYNLQTRPPIYSQFVTDIVHSADVLLSKTLDEIVSSKSLLDGEYTSCLDVWFTRVSVIRGITTQILLLSLEELIKEKGYEPVAWHQDGTVYCLRKGSPKLTLEQDIVTRVVQKLKQIVFADSSKLAKASFGEIGQQAITEPVFLFYSDEVIKQFWKQRFKEFRMDLYTEKSAKTDYFEREQLEQQDKEKLTEELGINEKELHDRLRRFKEFDFKVFNTLMGIEKQVRENVKQNKKIAEIIQSVYSKLGVQPPSEKPTHTMQKKSRLEFAKSLWKSEYYVNPNQWEEKLYDAVLQATLELKELFREAQDPEKFLDHIARLLVNEITEPTTPDAFTRIRQSHSDYLKGKKRGTPLCVICNGPAELTAQAKVLGESEIYHDSLPAGSEIGGENKLRICELCDFEYKVRRLLLVDFENAYAFAIAPHIAISRESYLYWRTLADSLAQENFAPVNLDDPEFLEQILESEDTFMKIVQEVWLSYLMSLRNFDVKSLFKDKRFKDSLQTLISRLGDPSPLLEEVPKDVDISNMDEEQLIKLLEQGKVRLTNERLHEILGLMRRVQAVCYTGNYVLIFTEPVWGEGATGQLKWLLYRTILAKLFLATVFDVTTSIVFNESKKGYTKFPSDVLFKDYSRKLSVKEGWIAIDGLENALTKLCSLVLVERVLSRAKADYGKDTLLRILAAEPGEVVARYVQHSDPEKSSKYMKQLIRALELWSDG
jgi:hypothetical protein